jgi:apolipoprotein D and lipocalin family protein
MKTILLAGLVFCALAVSAPSGQKPPLATVTSVDLQKYMGTWYEIAAFPQKFQKGCHCTAANYEMTDKGYVRVVNTCRKDAADGKAKTASGKAFVVEGTGNAKLKVQFFWPFRGDYWIIDLAEDYSYAVVGAPNRDYLWILARTPRMEETLYQEIVARCAAKAFDVSRLARTDQSCSGR